MSDEQLFSTTEARRPKGLDPPSCVSVVESTGKIPRIANCVFSEEFFQELSSLDTSKKNTPGDFLLSSNKSRLNMSRSRETSCFYS